jgi:hypothetical protein
MTKTMTHPQTLVQLSTAEMQSVGGGMLPPAYWAGVQKVRASVGALGNAYSFGDQRATGSE